MHNYKVATCKHVCSKKNCEGTHLTHHIAGEKMIQQCCASEIFTPAYLLTNIHKSQNLYHHQSQQYSDM